MLYRNKDGSYTGSSIDGEYITELTKEQGEEILKRLVSEPYLSKILSESESGFVFS